MDKIKLKLVIQLIVILVVLFVVGISGIKIIIQKNKFMV